jgi:hypothetical protein
LSALIASSQTSQDETPEHIISRWRASSTEWCEFENDIRLVTTSIDRESVRTTIEPALKEFRSISSIIHALDSKTIPASLQARRNANFDLLERIVISLDFRPLSFYPSLILRELFSVMTVVSGLPGDSLLNDEGNILLLFEGCLGESIAKGSAPTQIYKPGAVLSQGDYSVIEKCTFGQIPKNKIGKIKDQQDVMNENRSRIFLASQPPFCALSISRFSNIMPLLTRRNFQAGEILFGNSQTPIFFLLRGKLLSHATAILRDAKNQKYKKFKNVPWLAMEPGQIFGLTQAAFGRGVEVTGNSVIAEKTVIAQSPGEILIFSDFAKFLRMQPEMDFAMVYLAKSCRDQDLEISSRQLKILAAQDLTKINLSFIPQMTATAFGNPSRYRNFQVNQALISFGKLLREKEKFNGVDILQNIKHKF